MTNCKERVMIGYHMRHCARNATKDGYCFQHHPDAVAERERKSQAEWDARQANSPWARLKRCQEKLNFCHTIILEGVTTPEQKEYIQKLEEERTELQTT